MRPPRRLLPAALAAALHIAAAGVVLFAPPRQSGTGDRSPEITIQLPPAAPAQRVLPAVRPHLVQPSRARDVPAPRIEIEAAASTAISAPPPAPSADRTAIRAAGRRDYGGKLWAIIAAHKPSGIRLDGEAVVLFAVDGDGRLVEVRLSRSSGNDRLDALALDTVRRAAPFPAPPPELESADLRFTIPFAFR